MRRTEWLQETRKMRFEEAYEGGQVRRLTQEEAARLLGVCERSFRRYIDRYEEAGLEGLLDKRLEQVSQRRAPVDEVLAVTEQYRRRHVGWNVKHFYAWYRREGGGRWLRALLAAPPSTLKSGQFYLLTTRLLGARFIRYAFAAHVFEPERSAAPRTGIEIPEDITDASSGLTQKF
jgi:hypothetical protein